MAKFLGVIIEESLENKDVLNDVTITESKVEPATEKHNTPWLKQWTMHTVEIHDDQIDDIAEKLSRSLDSQHHWYCDFKNETTHYIIFRNKVFKIDRTKKEEYDKATAYGVTLGIPDYQLDFSPHVKQWERGL
ncbi:MAG: hypothetical protein HY340_00455 [Candidatus Kerfeldbacteria bacterium]|nr:hypothetical protein [Candidatus Kerfeldbacteria bacterium]